MRRLAILAIPLLLVALAGCPAGPDASTNSEGGPVLPGTEPAQPAQPTHCILIANLRMATVEVPVGMVSGSEDLWSYVDEEPVAAARSATLSRNGLRIGVGRGRSWDDMTRVLKRMTGRPIHESQFASQPGVPHHVILHEGRPIQTIFLSYSDRTLSGADYPPGDDLLSLSCTLSEDDPNSMVITGLPQIRSSQCRLQVVREGGTAMLVERPTMFPFSALTFQVPVSKGDFLVVGPGAESRRSSSVGNSFLVRQKEGMEFETVLIILPEVIRKFQ